MEGVEVHENTTVAAADIARLAGVGRAAVSNWRRRHPDFPQPVGGTPASPVFSLAEIETWLQGQGKLREVPLEERVWQHLRAIGDDLHLGVMVADVGAFIRHLHTGDIRSEIAGQNDQEVVARTQVDPRLASVFQGVTELVDGWGAAETLEFLISRHLEAQPRRTPAIPPELAMLMAELLGSGVESVLDPACGIGTLLLSAFERSARRLLGQDQDDASARLAEARLALRAVDAEVRIGDSLSHDAFPGVTVDAVLCDPPFNDRHWGYEELTSDPRWEYGLPPRMESELAWVQHSLAHLRPGGVAIVLMPPAAASRRSGRRIRAQLLRRGALRAVIAVSSGHHLWVLRRPGADRSGGQGGPPTTVLMIDGAGAAAIVRAWRDFQAGMDLDDPETSRAVSIIDLLDDEVDVTPGRHLPRPEASQTAERFAATRDRLTALLDGLSGLMPVAEPAAGQNVQEVPVTSVADLARIGALAIHQASSRAETDPEAMVGEPLLTNEDVVAGREPTGRVVTTDATDRRIVTRAGDVVVTVVARRFAARVMERPGAILGPQLMLMRVDPTVLDPHYLAGVLRSTANVRSSALLSTGGRVDIRRAQVPRLPLDEQRGYGEAFRRMEEFGSALRRSLALGEDMAQLLADGVVDGTLQASDG